MSRWKVTKAYSVWYAIEHGRKSYQGFIAWAGATAHAGRKNSAIPWHCHQGPAVSDKMWTMPS